MEIHCSQKKCCVRSKTKTKVQAGPLWDNHGQEVSRPGAMADIFNKQFLSAFTAEDTTSIPQPADIFEWLDSDHLLNVEISVDVVKTSLASLREDE